MDLDRSLDEILEQNGKPDRRPRGGNRNNVRRRERQDNYPRDGVRKTYRDDAPSRMDTEWVHDRFDGNDQRSRGRRRASPDLTFPDPTKEATLRVDNVHYELTQADLEGLFTEIGPITRLEIRYDRAGRSEGTAFVTYENYLDAQEAIKQFDGANAAGQPIRLELCKPRGGGGARRGAAGVASAGRSLADRITVPAGRSRSLSPTSEGRLEILRKIELEDEEAARMGIDRYRPGGRGGRGGGGGGRGHARGGVRDESWSPNPPSSGGGGRRRGNRAGGRRAGQLREGGSGGGGGSGAEGGAGGLNMRNGRPRKTQDELDAEMEDYFNSIGKNNGDGGGGDGDGDGATGAPGSGMATIVDDDANMIE